MHKPHASALRHSRLLSCAREARTRGRVIGLSVGCLLPRVLAHKG